MNLAELSKEVTRCRKFYLQSELITIILKYAEQENSVITKPSEKELKKFVESYFNMSTRDFIQSLRYKF